MATTDFTLTLTTEQTPQEVFQAVIDVRNWWSGYYSEEITGNTKKLNDEFSFRAGEVGHYSKHKLVELIPNKRVVWQITDSKLSFLKKKDEWTGTKMIFEISGKDNRTQLTFTHEGLNPEIECYDSCAPAWTLYIENKLLPLISADKVR